MTMKKAAANQSTHRTKQEPDKGSNYFDIVRSLSNDPEFQKAADETEQRLEREQTD